MSDGASFANWPALRTPDISSALPDAATIESGTSWMLSARFCAVTTISSSCASASIACALVAAGQPSAIMIATTEPLPFHASFIIPSHFEPQAFLALAAAVAATLLPSTWSELAVKINMFNTYIIHYEVFQETNFRQFSRSAG
ncbi:hypothetical protein [Rhizorhabdus dicambivorans]|uniref:hypothetical protein n=1 Tax=Rhizorhabdus dicambivorans TaxID=1850238 RepID=UPI001EDE29B8|nr:hypothetical protein [Rhizorhabdus dicambivorans]